MPPPSLRVHLCPALLRPDELTGRAAVVIDALRATTTICHAFAAGCLAVRPCATIDEARAAAASLAPARVVLAGERHGVPIPGFDAGNSPGEFTPARCAGATVVMTTSNGTRALLAAAAAEVVLVACFNNLSAVCHHLAAQARPVVVVCAGDAGRVALEDVLVAGAIVSRLQPIELDDGARLAEAAYERHRADVEGAFRHCSGGVRLRSLGYADDVRVAAHLDTLALVPRLERQPLRLTVGPGPATAALR